ncbi:hypothetical protein HKX48_003095 [Thoreauomyces humboldtii]|nr:hypothetical protein HKX48_003095 [Thoreauomyces humboldtii]
MLGAVAAYLVLVNVAAAGLFFYDKHQAKTRGWRVPEKTLQMTALVGGWIGGMWAMKAARHKTVKQSFQTPYMLCVAGNVVLVGAGLAMTWRVGSGQVMAKIAKQLSSASGNRPRR